MRKGLRAARGIGGAALAAAAPGIARAGAAAEPTAGPGWVAALLAWALVAALAFVLARTARSHWRQWLLALGVTLVLLAGAEWLLRRTGLGVEAQRGIPSPEYHHVNRPDSERLVGYRDGERVVVRTNEDGLRTRHTRAAFLEHETRIAVLGDSFTFGFLVDEEHAFPRVLESLLARDETGSVAVLNAGIVSSSPLLQARLWRGVVRHYAPQLVVLVLDATDVGDDLFYARQLLPGGERFDVPEPRPDLGRVAERLGPLLDALAVPLRAAGLAGGARAPDYYAFELEIGGALETNRYFIYRHPLSRTRPYFEATLDHVRGLAADVHAAGAELVLVVAPRFHHWNRAEAPRNWEADQYALDEPHQYALFEFFEAARAEVDFPIVSLLPAFRASRAFPLVFEQDPHWNEAGHDLVARALYDHLRDASLLPPPRAPEP